MKKKSALKNTLKGTVIGSAMLIPGVSGGTTAIILDVYDDLISSVSSFFKDTKKSLFTLLTIGVGALLGILFFSKAILYITSKFYMPMMFLFFGAVLGSIPMLYRKAEIKRFSLGTIVYPLIGAGLVLIMEFIPKDSLKIPVGAGWMSYLVVILAGLILSVAFVLPGISVSYMLLILGIYETTLTAIENMEYMFLITLLVGIALGVLLSTRILEKSMKNHPQATYLLIIGFVLVSLKEIFPGIPLGLGIIESIITFLVGFISVFYLSKLSK